MTIRYSPEGLTDFRATGQGWRNRMDASLNERVAATAERTGHLDDEACCRGRNGLQFDRCRTSRRDQVMQEIVSIRDANQHLSRYLERVEQGAEIIITRRGKPIARVLPIVETRPRLSEDQIAARERLRERMSRGYALGGIRPDRDSLHERGQ